MLRLTRVVPTVLALVALVLPVASAQESAPPPKEVRVQVVCRPNDEGPASVTVDPWLLLLNVNDPATWKLNITQPKKNWIVVEPKRGKPWPYEKKRHEGEHEAHARGMVPQPEGDYTYNITVWCNDEGTVIDPRVRVGP